MTLDLRTLILATTVAVIAPIAPSTFASQGSANAPSKDDDPLETSAASASSIPEAGDSPQSEEPGSVEPATDSEKTATTKPKKKPVRHSGGKSIDSELRCLALNIYHEARSEPEVGQEAVAAVTLNRVKSKSFPSSVCKVVKQGGQKRNRCQFSWWCDGRSDQATEKAAWQRALEIGRESLLGVRDDPTNGATFYHTHKVRPRWARKFHRTARIGDHIFYSPTPNGSVKVASAE